jgi:prepilin-type N-terminal cleavage/methylation domain-containing protein
MTTRRGFTLVELLIGLILLIAVGAVAYQLLVNTQRMSRSQGNHIGMQDNVRSGAMIIANELREVGYDQITATELAALQLRYAGTNLAAGVNSDLIAIGPDSITYRAMRGLGYTCQLVPATNDIVVINNPLDPTRKWQALRTLTTTDSLMLYVENDPSTSTDDLWLTVGLTTAPVAQNCPDGTAGIRFRIGWPVGLVPGIASVLDPVNNMPLGGPVRAFEVMQMRSYVSGGKAWLGMRSRPSVPANPIEPVLGPLANSAQGLVFDFRTATDGAAALPADVRSIQVSLRSVSEGMNRTTGKYAKVESLDITTRVALRNALRP